MRDASFHIEGPKLFNSIPKVVRDCTNLDEMKVLLDLFLATLPDHPKIPGSVPEALTGWETIKLCERLGQITPRHTQVGTQWPTPSHLDPEKDGQYCPEVMDP